MVSHSPGDIAAVAVLRPMAFRLQAKDGAGAVDLHDAEVVEVPTGAPGRPSAGDVFSSLSLSSKRIKHLTPGCVSCTSVEHGSRCAC